MTEKQKRDQQELYNPVSDEQLMKELIRAKDMCFKYNSLSPLDTDNRNAIIKDLFGATGENFSIMPYFWCDYGYNIEIGENFFANHNCVMLDCAKIKFGDNVLIGPDCGFYTAGHPIKISERNTGREYSKPITVGNNVWIGGGVKVMPGVTIGDNCVIGAGSVVTRNIPSNVIAVGNPCKVYRNLTEEELSNK